MQASNSSIPDIKKYSQYTPISEIQLNEYFNVAGVLIDFCGGFKKEQDFAFTLMDHSGKVEITYFINSKKLLPSFSHNYQFIVIHHILFQEGENGSLIGLLNAQARYRILTHDDLENHQNYKMMVSKVKEVNGYNSSLSSCSELKLEPKIRKSTNQIEIIQSTTLSSQNRVTREEDTITVSSRNELSKLPVSLEISSPHPRPNALADIQPRQNLQIVAQIVKLEKSFNQLCEFLITDYSCNNSLSFSNIELPDSNFLNGNYFLKLTVWDDQREQLLKAPSFSIFHFSYVRSKLDKMNQLELFINGTKPQYYSNTSTLLTIDHKESNKLKERRDEIFGISTTILSSSSGNIKEFKNTTTPTLSSETIRESKNNTTLSSSNENIRESNFRLVQDLQTWGNCDMILLILKKFKSVDNLILLCTDFTSSPLLKYHPYSSDKGINLDPSMCVYLICWDDVAILVEEVMNKNPNRNILQFRGLNVDKTSKNGIELHLRSFDVITDKNNCKILNFNPIPSEDSFYYKELVKRHRSYYAKFTPKIHTTKNYSEFMIAEGFNF